MASGEGHGGQAYVVAAVVVEAKVEVVETVEAGMAAVAWAGVEMEMVVEVTAGAEEAREMEMAAASQVEAA